MSTKKTALAKLIGVTLVGSDDKGNELPVKFEPVKNKADNVTKLVAAFAPVGPNEGDGSARALKAHFKAANPRWSSKDIREAVQKSLRNGENVRIVAALALHGAWIKAGALPDYGQMSVDGMRGSINYTMAGRTPPSTDEKKLSKAASELAAQKAENAALAEKLAKLEALVASLVPAAPAAAELAPSAS